jgi:hypothetical protein
VRGCRCSPSGMRVKYGGAGSWNVGSEIKPASPGSRLEKGGIAFSVCVRHVAPVVRPDRPWAKVAVVWPRDTRMLLLTREEIRVEEEGSSGARVASLMEVLRFEEP